VLIVKSVLLPMLYVTSVEPLDTAAQEKAAADALELLKAQEARLQLEVEVQELKHKLKQAQQELALSEGKERNRARECDALHGTVGAVLNEVSLTFP
jgi:predicted ribosome quality control (RQC) complex YloA/Tae2 family protein